MWPGPLPLADLFERNVDGVHDPELAQGSGLDRPEDLTRQFIGVLHRADFLESMTQPSDIKNR